MNTSNRPLALAASLAAACTTVEIDRAQDELGFELPAFAISYQMHHGDEGTVTGTVTDYHQSHDETGAVLSAHLELSGAVAGSFELLAEDAGGTVTLSLIDSEGNLVYESHASSSGLWVAQPTADGTAQAFASGDVAALAAGPPLDWGTVWFGCPPLTGELPQLPYHRTAVEALRALHRAYGFRPAIACAPMVHLTNAFAPALAKELGYSSLALLAMWMEGDPPADEAEFTPEELEEAIRSKVGASGGGDLFRGGDLRWDWPGGVNPKPDETCTEPAGGAPNLFFGDTKQLGVAGDAIGGYVKLTSTRSKSATSVSKTTAAAASPKIVDKSCGGLPGAVGLTWTGIHGLAIVACKQAFGGTCCPDTKQDEAGLLTMHVQDAVSKTAVVTGNGTNGVTAVTGSLTVCFPADPKGGHHWTKPIVLGGPRVRSRIW